MKTINTVCVVGGDTRQIYTAKRLAELGLKVSLYGFAHFGGALPAPSVASPEEGMACDAVLLPLPCTKNGRTLNAPFAQKELPLRELEAMTRPGAVIFAGMAPEAFAKTLFAKGAAVFDYYKNEALTVKNALLTAEGVLGILIEKTPVTIWRMKAAVTGYGRVSRFLCRAMKALGAEVTVYARDPAQLAAAETAGMRTERIAGLPRQADRYDAIVNTVPAPVVTEEAVRKARPDCLIVEVAGAPYGVDADACKQHGRELVRAFSLPGKTAPGTAGILIADTVVGMIKEANL